MEIRELRSFCTVAEYRSVTKAAEQLDLGQPTVTLHIKALEREFGAPLFDRTRRPLVLTKLGSKLFDLASPILGQVDALPNELVGSYAPQSIVLAATTELVESVAADALASYRTDHPEVDLRVRSGRVSEVLQMVRTREADFALMPDLEGEATVTPHVIFICERVLLAPHGHPISALDITYAEIARWPLIVNSSRNDAPSYIEEQLERSRLPYRTIMELDSCQAVKRYVAAGLGISVLPLICVDPSDKERLDVVRIPQLLPRYRVGIMRPTGAFLPAYVSRFIDALVTALSARFDTTIHPRRPDITGEPGDAQEERMAERR